MSLQTNGVWAAGVWASTVWADCVWYETICIIAAKRVRLFISNVSRLGLR